MISYVFNSKTVYLCGGIIIGFAAGTALNAVFNRSKQRSLSNYLEVNEDVVSTICAMEREMRICLIEDQKHFVMFSNLLLQIKDDLLKVRYYLFLL